MIRANSKLSTPTDNSHSWVLCKFLSAIDQCQVLRVKIKNVRPVHLSQRHLSPWLTQTSTAIVIVSQLSLDPGSTGHAQVHQS